MKAVRFNSWILAASTLVAAIVHSGCGSGSTAAPPPRLLAISVGVSPAGAQTIDQGQIKEFTATVNNDPGNKGVTWTLTQNGTPCSPGCGMLSTTNTLSGTATTYTAPAAVNANLQFRVTATSVADNTKSATDVTTAVPPPTLNNPAQLPAALVGKPYSFTLTESGGVSPFTWSITSGALPAGLSLNSATGVISGTPTVASSVIAASPRPQLALQPNVTPSGFTAQGCDSGSPQLCNSQALSMQVNVLNALPACSSGNNPITAQPAFIPASVTLSGSPQTSTVSVTAPSAVSYQWFVGAQPSITGSSPIQGATLASYTTPTLTGAYAGLSYSVLVSTATCSQMSDSAFLTLKENPNGSGPIQIPTIQEVSGTIALTQSGGTQYFACQSATPIGGSNPTCPAGNPVDIDWAVYLNGDACNSGCGSFVPAMTQAGLTTTYVAPKGMPLTGQTFTILATNASDPTEFASADITVKPCVSPYPMCGGVTFYIQGFDANGNAAATAGHFTATGLVNNDLTQTPPKIMEITEGVMDINDMDGLDVALPIISGSYTFDQDPTTGALLPNLNALTGTITLNTASTIPSHQRRTYAFTATSIIGGGSLIEFEPSQMGNPPVTNPAAGFQGSGSLWVIGAPGPYGFPVTNSGRSTCTTNPPSNCNYAFGFEGAGSSGPLGTAGVFNVSLDANNNCILSSGPTDVVRNQPGNGLLPQPPVAGNVSGSCGPVSTIGGVPVADDVNGRGTASITFTSPGASGGGNTFAYYVTGTGLFFMDVTGAGSILSGLARPTGVSSAAPLNTMNCGTVLVFSGTENCVVYLSGGPGAALAGGGASSNGVTLTVGQLTCGPIGCKEPLPPIANQTLTGQLSGTFDQMAGGTPNVFNPCPPATTANPMPPVCGYSINITTGVGYICLAVACPNGLVDSHAIVFADGFLLANDGTAAVGSLKPQFFAKAETPTPGNPAPCGMDSSGNPNICNPEPLADPPGPDLFAAVTIPSFLSIVPNATGNFDLTPAAAYPNDFNGPFDGNLGVSGSQIPMSPIPLTPVTGAYQFDVGANANCTMNVCTSLLIGRGVGSSNAPGPAKFVYYEAHGGDIIVMQTDNPISGGQVLLELQAQSPSLAVTSDSSATFTIGQAANCNANPAINCFTVTATGLPVPPLSEAVVPATSMLPNGLTFVDNGNGTATFSGSPATGSAGTYILTIAAHNQAKGAVAGCPPQGSDVCQTFVLTVQ